MYDGEYGHTQKNSDSNQIKGFSIALSFNISSLRLKIQNHFDLQPITLFRALS